MPQLRAAPRPTTLGHYALIERLGAGGQGEVWRAHDESRGVDIALKILAASVARNPAAWEALEREHAISCRLQHPGILQVLQPERVGDVVLLPMELAAGGDLRRLLGAGYLEIVPVLLEVAEALEYAHARGVVHRDLKPGNVLFDGRGRVKLADFGIAALLPLAGAGAAELRGAGHSPFTASPEQLRGEPASAADDIYGLGALAYELLSGHPPYYPNFDLRRALTQPVPELVPTRQIPPELGELVMRMLAKRSAERPASMQQAMDELDSTLNATLSFAPEGVEGAGADAPESVGPPARGGSVEGASDAEGAGSPQPVTARPSAYLPSEPRTAASAAPVKAPPVGRSEIRPTSKHAADERAERRPVPAAAPAPAPAARRKCEPSPAPAPSGMPPESPAASVGRVDPPAGPPAGTRMPAPPAYPASTRQRAAQQLTQPVRLPVEPITPGTPFELGMSQPPLRATPPPGRRQATPRPSGGRARHWPYLVSGLLCGAALICGATAAALFWLPRHDRVELQKLLASIAAVAVPRPATAPALAAHAPKPQADPAALARLSADRADFQRRAAALEARGAAAWDGAEFSAAQMQAAESSGAAAAGGIPIALQHMKRAEQLLASVAAKAPQALAAELESGGAAMVAGHQERASQAFALARRIDPNSRRAIDGARRARLLNGLLPLFADARRAEAAQDYSRAAQDFSQALALDPDDPVAKQGLARVNAAFGDDSYARAVGAGFAALGGGRLREAQGDFKQALAFRPGGAEATEGLQRVRAAMQASRVAALGQRAANLEAQEHWNQAVAAYDAILRVDPSLAFAERGKTRDEARARLSASLQRIIDHPSRIALQSVRDEAVALLQEAREQTPSGPVLQSQVERVGELLPQLDRPVLLNLISDKATQVTIPSIGVFGKFGRRQIRLKPGTYTVIGTRDGYRAVHQEFTVEPGQQSVTITVSCSEHI